MKPPVFIAVIVLAALLGAAIALNWHRCPEPIPQDQRIAFTLDSLKADGLRKDTLISVLLSQEPVTIRIREQLPRSSSLVLDSLRADLLADPL